MVAGFGQRDRFGRHDVGQRTAEHHRAAPVDGVSELGLAEHHAAAGTAQRFVRRGRDDLGVWNRIEVAGEDLASDQAREVGHVDEQHRADSSAISRILAKLIRRG